MRKILSVIMVIAMLATSILPAVANVSAADADALTIEMSTVGFVENEDGTASADIDLNITNNPGITDLVVLVYYNNTEITGTNLSNYDGDYALSANGVKSTHRNVKNFFANAGVATAATISCDYLTIGYYDLDSGDPFVNADTGVIGTFTASVDSYSADMAYEIGIIVTEAYDVDGNEVAVDPVTYAMEVTAKPEDPYATKYDVETFPEDQFVINVTGTKVFENGFVEGEIPTADVNVEFYGNNEANNPFGVWGYRAFIYYPAELNAIAYANGDIFKDTEMQQFEDCATNIDVTEELAKDEPHAAVYAAISGFEYVGYDSYADDGIKISVIQHLGTNWYDVTYGDGVLETITFQLPEDVAAGDKWEIGICANGTGDICYNGGSTPENQNPDLQPAPIAATFDNGYIEVISVKDESFEEFTFNAEDITISADNKTATVNVYVDGNAAEVNPYGFWSARLFFYYPAELSLTKIEEGKIVPAGGFTLGNFNFDLQAVVDDPAYANNAVVKGAPLAFADKGFDWENEDFRLTTVYFEAPSDDLCITKDGHYATLTFEIPEGAAAGDSWYVGIATCYENADVIGYLDDPALSTTVAERLTHALDDGSITLGGDVVVDPEPPVHEHVLEYTAAVEAGCHYTGNTEYWYCAGCDTVFADEACTIVTNRLNVVIPAKGSDLLVHVPACEAACHYDGCIEYWMCYECEQVWADEALTQLTNIKNVVVPATGSENLHHVEYLAPTYEANGNIEYWYCDDCGQVWQDEALTQLTNRMNVIIPMLTKATVTVGTATVVKGENAEIAVTLVNNPGLFISKYVITYDASVITLLEATNGDVFAADDVIINTDVAGQIIVYFENADIVADVTANGTLVNLVFATDAEGEPAEVALEIVAEEGNNINAAGEDVAIDVVAGKVTIVNCTHEGTELTPNQVKAPTVYEEGIMEYICECGEVAYTEAIAKLAGIELDECWDSVTAGERFAYGVRLLNNPGVWSLSMTFAYDPYVLEFVQVDSELFTADEYSYSVADGVVTVYVESDSLDNIVDDGAAFWLVFDAISCGYSDIDGTLVADNTINAAGENVSFEVIDGLVLAGCNLIHSEYVAPTATENGWQEFWYCEFCGAMFSDEQGRFMTNRMNCYIPPVSIDLNNWAEVYEGDQAVIDVDLTSNPGIWSLSLKVSYDAENLTFAGLTSGLFAVDEYSYSVADGVITIYVENAEIADIVDNGTAFSIVFDTTVGGYYNIDAELVAENTINAAGENVEFGVNDYDLEVIHQCNLVHVPAVEASCHQNGMNEYWYCDADYCGAVYADAEGRYITNRMNLVIPMTAELVYVEAVEATCHQNGSAAYYYCTECDAVFDEDLVLTNRKNLTIPYTAEIIYVEAAEATCCQAGNVEYWYCSECDAVFADAALTQLTNRKNVMIPATAEIAYVEAVEATCHQNGSAAYYYCTECDAVYDEDFRLTNRKNLTIPATAEIIYVEAVEPTCCQTGNYEYWYCSECDAVFADAALTILTNRRNLTIPATAEIAYVEAVEATCHQNGSAAYYYCTECDAVYDEDFRLTNRKNLTIPATAEIIYVEAVEPTCCQTGSYEYWYCSECDAVFADAALTILTNRRNLTIPATAEIIYVEAVEPTCCQNGSAAYYYCSECDSVFDENFVLTNRKNLTIPATAEIIYVEAVEATCGQNGSAAYYYCSECDAVFDENFILTNRKNLTIPATGEHVAGDKVITVEPTETTDGAWEIRCSVCNELLESGTIAALKFITKASGTDYVKSVTLEGDVITVVARPNAPYVKVAVGYDKGIKIASDNLTIFYNTYSYLNINYGESATIIATDANGNTKEYTVVVEWSDEFYTSYVGGYTTENVDVSEDIFNVYVKTNMNNASIGFVLTDGTTYEASEGLQVVLSGGKVYFKALKAEENSYTVTFTTRAGAVKVVTINFIYDFENVEGAQGGYMVDGITLGDNNTINLTVNKSYSYASFRFILKNTTSSIEWDEETVDVVISQNIHWFKIYNDGTDYVTKTFVVTNNANGVVDTYTVNVTFGSDN